MMSVVMGVEMMIMTRFVASLYCGGDGCGDDDECGDGVVMVW